MKPYERRQTNHYPYFKLAQWNPLSFCWHDGKVAFDTKPQAVTAAVKTGKYRLSQIDENGRTDLEPFCV